MNEKTNETQDREVKIVSFSQKHLSDFISLNVEWLEKYFTVEKKDILQIEGVQTNIIDKGGAVLIAEDNSGKAIGCVALVPYAEKELELAKMAVSPSAQGLGVGRKLMNAAIDQARAMGATSIYLESNSTLIPAVTLYERSGFRHLLPAERPTSPYARCDVYMRRPL